jgi:hypothetical protein
MEKNSKVNRIFKSAYLKVFILFFLQNISDNQIAYKVLSHLNFINKQTSSP